MAKMTNCKTCNTEIASSAKTCPNCGAKRSGLLKKLFLALLVIFVVLLLIGIMVPSPSNSTRSSSGEVSKAPQTSFSVGETVASGEFSIAVLNVSTRQQVGIDFLAEQASGGAVYVVVNFAYINEGDRPINPFRAPSISLIDPNGVEYELDVGATASYATEIDLNSKLISEINPGIQLDDAGVFEVAETRFSQFGWKVKVDNGRNDFFVTIE